MAIIGIISGIAIPSYLGQRRRARVIGDAISNAQVLRMQLETRKADDGIYGTAGASLYPLDRRDALQFHLPAKLHPKGNSNMNYALALGSTGLTSPFRDRPEYGSGVVASKTDQTGAQLARLNSGCREGSRNHTRRSLTHLLFVFFGIFDHRDQRPQERFYFGSLSLERGLIHSPHALQCVTSIVVIVGSTFEQGLVDPRGRIPWPILLTSLARS